MAHAKKKTPGISGICSVDLEGTAKQSYLRTQPNYCVHALRLVRIYVYIRTDTCGHSRTDHMRPFLCSWICSTLKKYLLVRSHELLPRKMLEIGLPRLRRSWSFFQDQSRAVSRFSRGPVAGSHRQYFYDSTGLNTITISDRIEENVVCCFFHRKHSTSNDLEFSLLVRSIQSCFRSDREKQKKRRFFSIRLEIVIVFDPVGS